MEILFYWIVLQDGSEYGQVILTQKWRSWVSESVCLKTLMENPLYKGLLGHFCHYRMQGQECRTVFGEFLAWLEGHALGLLLSGRA